MKLDLRSLFGLLCTAVAETRNSTKLEHFLNVKKVGDGSRHLRKFRIQKTATNICLVYVVGIFDHISLTKHPITLAPAGLSTSIPPPLPHPHFYILNAS